MPSDDLDARRSGRAGRGPDGHPHERPQPSTDERATLHDRGESWLTPSVGQHLPPIGYWDESFDPRTDVSTSARRPIILAASARSATASTWHSLVADAEKAAEERGFRRGLIHGLIWAALAGILIAVGYWVWVQRFLHA
jgi:hypothetical protein